MPVMNRRTALIACVAVTLPFPSTAAIPTIHVVKGTGCECCEQWTAHLRENGFAVTDEERYGMFLIHFKMERGVPPKAYSCHTGMVEGYVLEGHVPVDDIRRLLSERPEAVGLAVPGMPYGSPGMGPEDQREAYDVFLICKNGSMQVYSSYPQGNP
jgi:hypothetical protein